MNSRESILAAGIDVGSSAVKFVLAQVAANGAESVLALHNERIRRRELRKVIKEGYEVVLEAAGVRQNEIAYAASTGEGELVDFRSGHFYGMTTHARGAVFLMPGTGAVIDIGALHARAMRVDERSRVLAYRMTNQCASGSGQFLENVAALPWHHAGGRWTFVLRSKESGTGQQYLRRAGGDRCDQHGEPWYFA